jgi:hypothetical protein
LQAKSQAAGRVIGHRNNKRAPPRCAALRQRHHTGEGIVVGQSIPGRGGGIIVMAAVVDPRPLNHQAEASFMSGESAESDLDHLGQRGLHLAPGALRRPVHAVDLIVHVLVCEEAKHRLSWCSPRLARKLPRILHQNVTARVLLEQVASIASPVVIVAPPATQQDIHRRIGLKLLLRNEFVKPSGCHVG